ncbi:hypothetical protein D3C75_904610 [compost metagenome]
MDGDNGKISLGCAFADFPLHPDRVQQIHQIRLALRYRNAVSAIGIGQKREGDPILLQYAEPCLVFLTPEGTGVRHADFIPISGGGEHSFFPLVQRMVVGHSDHVHPCIKESISHLIRAVEHGVGGQLQLLSSGDAFLVGHQDIRLG